MASENLKSGFITNRDATPKVLSNSSLVGGHLESAIGVIETTTASDPGSTYRMFQIPSNAIVHELKIYSDDMGTTGLIDVGIYKSTADGGAVVDADFFASALDVKAAALNGVDITHESGVFNIDDSEKPLWQALGLSSDPGLLYDVVATTTEVFSSGGTLVLKAKYVF
jgi:hypothetical protein